MLRTVQSLPLTGLSTLGFDPTRFPVEPPVCYRASWQLPGPDSHRQATTSTNSKITYTRSPPVPLGARKAKATDSKTATSNVSPRPQQQPKTEHQQASKGSTFQRRR
jgi:hypothetical protein